MGPVDLGRPARRVSRAWSTARSTAGAEVTVGGTRRTGAGFFYEPSVVVNPAQDSEIVQREVFGPVVSVQRFSDEDAGARVGERRRLRPLGERVDAATSAARCA